MNIMTKIKQTHNFTEGEKNFAAYIVNHPYEIVKLDIHQLSKKVMYLFRQFTESSKN